jgi:hypothetical protein
MGVSGLDVILHVMKTQCYLVVLPICCIDGDSHKEPCKLQLAVGRLRKWSLLDYESSIRISNFLELIEAVLTEVPTTMRIEDIFFTDHLACVQRRLI